MFSLFNFSSIFQGGQLIPFAPMCGHPWLRVIDRQIPLMLMLCVAGGDARRRVVQSQPQRTTNEQLASTASQLHAPVPDIDGRPPRCTGHVRTRCADEQSQAQSIVIRVYRTVVPNVITPCAIFIHMGWQWRNFVPYLCLLVFAAILWVKLGEMFATVISLKCSLLVS